MSADRRRPDAQDTPDGIAPPPDETLAVDETGRTEDAPENDEGVENIRKEGEPFGGNFA